MRALKVLLLCWLAVFIQSSLSGLISLWGLVPDMLSILVASVSLAATANAGVTAGILSGFLADCYSPQTMGLFTLSGCVSGFLAGAFRERIYREQAMTQAMVAGFLSMVRQLFDFWGHGSGGAGQYFHFLFRYGLGSAVYTLVMALLLVPVINRFLKQPKK